MKRFPKYRTIIVSLLVLVLISAIIVFAQSKQTYYQANDDVRVDNKTESLVVESILEMKQSGLLSSKDSEDNRKFKINLRNNYKKSVNYYTLQVKDVVTEKNNSISRVSSGGLINGTSFMPNEEIFNYFSASPKGQITLVVAAVLFEDGTGDGDPMHLTILQDERAGVKLGYQKIIPIIRQHLKENNTDDLNLAVKSLEEEISSLSEKDIPINQGGGFIGVKRYVISELNDLKNNLNSDSDFAYKSKLAEQLAKIEDRLAKL